MNPPDAYTARWLLSILGDDPTGLDLTQRAADLGCANDFDSVKAALEQIAGVIEAGPQLATAEDVIAGHARYADTLGGHADRRTLAAEQDGAA